MTGQHRLLTAIGSLFARVLVDRSYYLAQYPDIAASGVDPIAHFSSNWYRAPIRAPSRAAEPYIFRVAPLVVLVLHFLRRDRQDWLDCLRYRINELACTRATWQYRLSLGIARLVGTRLAQDPGRAATLHAGGLGVRLPVLEVAHNPALGIRVTTVAPAGRYVFTEPKAFDDPRDASRRDIPLPALTVASVENASVFGFFQVMAARSLLLYEPAADPSFRFVARQCEFVVACLPPRQRAVLARVPEKVDETIPEAVMLGGRCGANYFHFLIEYLTRGYAIEQIKSLDNLPIIVSDELFPQEFEALQLVMSDRTLIRRRHATRLDVGLLHIPSIMTYLPDSAEVDLWRTAAVNHASLTWLRERVLDALPHRSSEIAFPDKIYLSRSGARTITNGPDIEAIFVAHGFSIIDPSRYNFIDQVRLFADASVIAGPMGAAFSNLIFASSGTQVLMIASPFLVRFPIFASLAEFSGCEYYTLPGDHDNFCASMDDRRQALVLTHSNYSVDPSRLRQLLQSLIRPH